MVELRRKQCGTTLRRRKRRDFDAVYCLGVHNRSGGGAIPLSLHGNSITASNRPDRLSLIDCLYLGCYACRRRYNAVAMLYEWNEWTKDLMDKTVGQEGSKDHLHFPVTWQIIHKMRDKIQN